MSRSGRPYRPEFRRQMVELVHAGRSPEEPAREFEPTATVYPQLVAQAARMRGVAMAAWREQSARNSAACDVRTASVV